MIVQGCDPCPQKRYAQWRWGDGKRSGMAYPPVAPLPTGVAQKAHLFTAIGITLRHSGYSFVIGSGGASPRRMILPMNALMARIAEWIKSGLPTSPRIVMLRFG